MIFETHAHYDDKAFMGDRQELLAKLPEANVGRVVNIGSSIEACRKTVELMNEYSYIYGAIGVHPTEIGGLNEENFAWLKEQCSHKKCVAVGEIGLDYHWDTEEPAIQKEWFLRQLQLAREVKLPVVLHSREAAKDTLDIIKAERVDLIGGVMHCYSYSVEYAKILLNMGFYFGIGGVLTYKNAAKLKEVVKYLPMKSIVLETDCPYLSPVPKRGKRNSSLNLSYVVDTIAEIKNITTEEVEQITWENAMDLYRMEKERD
ncbi:TatD family hydrolase [Lachnospiraceae bacterium OttesenSCG-928-D06]|nr:TatD family hydrolase [Lachnospiraceae bacterium OttesenSCG-928-D06]